MYERVSRSVAFGRVTGEQEVSRLGRSSTNEISLPRAPLRVASVTNNPSVHHVGAEEVLARET